MLARIAGTGSFLPERVVDNNELSQMVETSDEWIQTRTGIKTRHIAEDDTAVSMAIHAAKRAVENAGITPDDIDMIIVSTVSSEQNLPCVACEVQAALGATHAASFDLNAACTGFITAYQMAAGQMAAGLIETALIIGTECLSNLIDWSDRSTCILFGDGAGAAVLQAEDTGEDNKIISVLHSDGTKGHVLTCSIGHGKDKTPFSDYVWMDGKEIYKFAVKQVPKVIKEILEMSGQTADDIDYFVLHQANRRILEAIAKRMHQDESKFPMNVMEHGNISSACIPVLLDSLNREGKLKKGMKLVVAGFGGGLTWGGFYMEW